GASCSSLGPRVQNLARGSSSGGVFVGTITPPLSSPYVGGIHRTPRVRDWVGASVDLESARSCRTNSCCWGGVGRALLRGFFWYISWDQNGRGGRSHRACTL
ncbi:unnamed protein product, partial [Hapterophycus canaliculatus]